MCTSVGWRLMCSPGWPQGWWSAQHSGCEPQSPNWLHKCRPTGCHQPQYCPQLCPCHGNWKSAYSISRCWSVSLCGPGEVTSFRRTWIRVCELEQLGLCSISVYNAKYETGRCWKRLSDMLVCARQNIGCNRSEIVFSWTRMAAHINNAEKIEMEEARAQTNALFELNLLL